MDVRYFPVDFYESTAMQKVSDAFQRLNNHSSNNPGMTSIMGSKTEIYVSFQHDKSNSWYPDGYIIINPDTIDSIQSVDSFGGAGGINRSLDRVIFHEIVHSITTPTQASYDAFSMPQAPGVNFAESAAIFAENLIFAPAYGEGLRAGHVLYNFPTSANNFTDMSGAGNVSGLGAFNWFGSSQDSVMHTTENGIVFSKSTADGSLGVFKTYHPSDHSFGGQISLLAQNEAGFVTVSSSGVITGQGWDAITSSIMGGGKAVSALSSLSSTLSAYSWMSAWNGARDQILGVGGDTFYDREETPLDTPRSAVRTYVFSGVSYKVIDGNKVELYTWAPPVIEVTANSSMHDIVLIGASASTSSITSKDDIKGGAGRDILISGNIRGGNVLDGGAANDVLIGSTYGSDEITGGNGDDLFIARGPGTIYHGGGDGGDVLSYHFMSAGVQVDIGAGTVRLASGLDSYNGMAKIVGTGLSDRFVLGEGVAVYGGGGNDTFLGIPGALVDGGSGIDTLRLEAGNQPLYLASANIRGVEIVEGSNGQDIILNGYLPDGTPLTINGMGGDDYIEVRNSTSVRAGSGNDTVKLLSAGYGILDGGSDHDTLDFSVLSGPLNVYLNENQFSIGTSSRISYTGFEAFIFGSADLYLVGSGTLSGGTGINRIVGGSGADVISVSGTGGYVYGGSGNDRITSSGAGSLYGDQGDDVIFGGNTGAILSGSYRPDNGSATIFDGNDTVHGGAGADILVGGNGHNDLHGGGGYDTFMSNGYGDNDIFGDDAGGVVRYSFGAIGGYPDDPELVSVRKIDDYFEVIVTPDRGQSYHVDKLHDIDRIVFDDRSYALISGFEYHSPTWAMPATDYFV